MQLFLPLIALQSGPLSLPKTLNIPPPPGTPRTPRKVNLEDDKQRRSALRQRVYDFDEDENKENEVPKDDELTSTLSDSLSRLLDKWDRDIDQLRDQVYHDFNVFKKRLGILLS